MTRETLALENLWGVYSVPPLPRKTDSRRGLDLDAAEKVAQHIADGGITRFLYGGNAFLYHISLGDYEALLDWLSGFSAPRWPIPSIGPSFGRALDQACLLRRHSFPTAMVLPCGDPRDPRGCEAGMRDIAEAAGIPLIIYLKAEDNFGSNIEQALDAIGRLVDDGVAVAIKYAIVRDDPGTDAVLEGLLARVDRRRVITGMGERPAIIHLRDFALGGMTTGSGCVAPSLCTAFLKACAEHNWAAAETLRAEFMPLEDVRDAWGPARVLHHATELAGIAPTGPILPYVSPLSADQLRQLAPIARGLKERDA